jgi:hypothetical protein
MTSVEHVSHFNIFLDTERSIGVMARSSDICQNLVAFIAESFALKTYITLNLHS